MPAPKEYQGHRSWNAWNVALYIGNEEPLYRLAQACYARAKSPAHAARLFGRETGLVGTRTPDGAVYTKLAVKLALEGLELTCGRA